MNTDEHRLKADALSVFICVHLWFAFFLAAAAGQAQIRYARGQDVAPAFEGWQQDLDGSYSLIFGYLNRNFEEEVDIPIGPNNTIEPGGDRGQPTHFYPRRQRFVFKVAVPKDWDKRRRVVWTLTSRGRTNQAKGWLQPEWEMNPGVISENSGGGVLAPGNEPPSIQGSPAQTIALPGTVALTATATDDGLPKPRPRPVTSRPEGEPPQRGVRIKWILYRGPGPVEFDPDTSPDAYGTPVTLASKASFRAPGTYVLRAIAGDGQLFAVHEVTVTVLK